MKLSQLDVPELILLFVYLINFILLSFILYIYSYPSMLHLGTNTKTHSLRVCILGQ